MWSRCWLAFPVFLLAAADLAAVADRPDKKKKTTPAQDELKKMEGSWTYVGSNANRVTIRRGTYTVNDPQGKVVLSAVMNLDPSKNPRWLTMRYTEGFYKGRTLLGIYELKGDTLRVSIDTTGKARPGAFPSGVYTSTLKRQKKTR